MALIVEDGTGLATANAYVDVAYVDAYHTLRCNDGWSGPVSKKEAAIIRATEYIDRRYSFQGLLIKDGLGDPGTAQVLAWPRFDVLDDYGREVDDESVPELVKRAAAEAALQALYWGSLSATAVTSRPTRRTERVGDVSTAETFDGGAVVVDGNLGGQLAPLDFPIVTEILRPLLAGPTLIRA